MNVKINTPINNDKELRIYSNKNVCLRISKYLEVFSKKLTETVNIGIITNNEIIKEQKNHIFNFLKNIVVNLNLMSSNYFF